MTTYVLDTNILLNNPQTLFAFENSTIVIPYDVVLELEKQKTRPDLTGRNARECIRILDSLFASSTVQDEISLPKNCVLRITSPKEELLNTDYEIIQVAKQESAKLVTHDLSMRIRAEISGVDVVRQELDQTFCFDDLQIRDRSSIGLSFEDRETLFCEKRVSLLGSFFPNEFLVTEQALGLYRKGFFHLLNERIEAFGIRPRSKEQIYALHALMDPSIPLVSLTGKAGCGKTLLAMAAALEMTLERKQYDHIIITRPIQPMGKDIGFLPGTETEKLRPWIQPLQDALTFLMKGQTKNIQMLFDQKVIELQALTFIRGRSLPRVFMICDESQNLSKAEIKAIVTRMGEGSKIVFTGDLNQIDTNRADPQTNGLFYLIDRMKDQELSAHINLIRGERSDLASLAADIL